MDYVSLKGLVNRIGVQKEELTKFAVKELIDNALDFIENNVRSSDIDSFVPPQVKVIITEDASYLRIRVLNSDCGAVGFTEQSIHSIFDFSKFSSSKRNQYKINRGALGDALKVVLCIPYALANENQNESWEEPLIITSGDKQFQIRVIVDKIKQAVSSDVKVKSVQGRNFDLIELEIRIPLIKNAYGSLDGLRWILQQYALVNTHVDFHFESPTSDNNGEKHLVLSYPHVQKMAKRWSNQISIFCYCYREFEQFIFSLNDDNDVIAYDIIKHFREGTNIRKDEALDTLGQLKNNPKMILDIYTRLRNALPPKKELDVPFEIRRKPRIESLRKRVEQFGVTVKGIKYVANRGYYKSEDEKVQFPFIFEVAVITTKNTSNGLLFYAEGINSSIPHGIPFSGYSNTFVWKTGTKTNNAQSVYEILERYGYSVDRSKCRKPGSIVILNLISPRIDYENYGKSQINLKPFADVIANTIFKTCVTHRNDNNVIAGKRLTATGILEMTLYKRLQAVEGNSNLKISDRWTQSTVYYRIRPRLIALGLDVSREHITISIRSTCEDKLGKARHELGIIAADRAQLYFKGKSHDVGLYELASLMQMGTDLLIIEKEGVVEVLAPFSNRYGIALLNTRGFLTEYATILSQLSERHGCNVAILTDLDVSGLLLAKKVPNIKRIGIDFDTLNYFNLSPNQVEEPYNAAKKHRKPLEKMAYDDIGLRPLLRFARYKRIEIDSVLAQVGNERFWNFVIHELRQKFPKRNYNRAIDVPEFIMPKKLEEMLESLKKNLASFVKSECQIIKNELSGFSGFIEDIEKKEKEIEDRIRNKITENKDVQSLVEQLERSILESSFYKSQFN